ncbi:MAG: M24 family metallopeptidase [Anaerolineae bacterium]
MNAKPYQQRVARCASLMQAAGIEALLLTKPANMQYLTGDGRLCAYALVTRQGQVALGVPKTDIADVAALAHYAHLTGFDDEVGMIHGIAHDLARYGISDGALGLEYTYVTQSMRAMLTHPHAKPADMGVLDATHVMTQLRLVKDAEEIERLTAAARVADIGVAAAIEAVVAGATESQVAAAGEYAMRQAGADEFWRSYVATGPRTSIAHGLPTQRRLQPGDAVLIDLHPIVDGYSADVCRTVFVGHVSDDQASAYALYANAQQSAIALASAGVTMATLEHTMHETIRQGGHGEHLFGPPIHGIGIEFEEPPLPAGHAFFHGEKEAPPLPANVVIAVGNCGIYTGAWGVRVEDTVVIGPDGPHLLTHADRALTVL